MTYVADSGATKHMSKDKHHFSTFTSTEQKIYQADGTYITATGHGDIQLIHNNRSHTLTNVYYVPKLSVNLISLAYICGKGYTTLMNSTNLQIYNNKNEILLTASKHDNNLYYFQFQLPSESPSTLELSLLTLDTWHTRLGHINSKHLLSTLNTYTNQKFTNSDIEPSKCTKWPGERSNN